MRKLLAKWSYFWAKEHLERLIDLRNETLKDLNEIENKLREATTKEARAKAQVLCC